MPMPSLIRREDSESKGRHLVANCHVTKGRLLMCERPMICLQSTGNVHSGVLVCHYCMAFCGTPAHAMEIATDPSILAEITTECTDSIALEEEEYALIPCRHKCGHVYCSLECQLDDWQFGGHRELCTGCIEDPEHPLVQFKRHAIETNEIFLLIAQWLARIHNHHVPYNEDDRENTHPFTDFMMNPWWDVATLPLKEEPTKLAEAAALEQSLKDLCEVSHSYLQQAWKTDQKEDSPWLTPIGISRLIGSLEQNCMGIRRKHPLRRNIMEDTDFRHKYHSQLIQCLERAGMVGCSDSEDEDSDLANHDGTENTVGNEKNVDYSYDEIAEFLSNLSTPLNIGSDDEWDEICMPLDGTAHFSIATKMNHSCDPNVVVLYKSRGWGRQHPLVAYCVALKDIAPGEELTISYITSDDPYDKRQEALANYGFVCTCAKCLKEKDGLIPSTSFQEDSVFGDGDGDEEDLFGDENENLFGDDEENESNHDDDINHNDATETNERFLCGERMLQNSVEQLESVLNKSVYLSVPVQYLAGVSNYVNQLGTSLLNDIQSGNGTFEDETLEQLLQQCVTAMQERDFSLCRIVGSSLEFHLYHMLESDGSWPNPFHRESYWCACVTTAVGFAQEGSFLVAMKVLDKAVILGQDRKKVRNFFSYVELHAHEMAATPCPPAIVCTVPDFQDSELIEKLSSLGLSKPISFPVREILCPHFELAKTIETIREPVVIRRFAAEWRAVAKWRHIDDLVREFGHRQVPIELGSISSGMKERLMSFRSFVATYLSPSASKDCWSLKDATTDVSSEIAYLAQHPLLDQIEALYEDVERNPCGLHPTNVNVWIGTGGTRTPLHFDSYDNILVQVVGAKYVRLYDTKQTPQLYVSKDKSYGLQGNMSEIDCEMEDFEKHPLAKSCPYREVLLLPGDCLFIPSRYWHYVRSLSTSISVNYWY